MRPLIVLAPLALLAACATPQEQCLSNVTQALRINASLIAQTQGNLDRGYGLETEQRIASSARVCYEREIDGDISPNFCDVPEYRTVTKPVPVNLRVERETLDQLLAKRAVLERQAAAGTAQCRALYPE